MIIKFCEAGREYSDGSDGLVCLGGRCPPRFDFCQVLIFIYCLAFCFRPIESIDRDFRKSVLWPWGRLLNDTTSVLDRRNWFPDSNHGVFFLALSARWWFQIFFMFTSTWGNDPIWPIFFKRVVSPPPRNGFFIAYMILFASRSPGRHLQVP